MFSVSYAWNELRRRLGRTIVTAFGLAAGVGLVMGIIGVSDGLSDAQTKVLSPLGSVGTDIIVTRTVAPTTSTATTTTTTPASGGGRGNFAGGGFAGGGGGFFAGGAGGGANAQSTDEVLANNSSVITDLSKLGKPGTKFTHDFFVTGTLITFPSAAVSDVNKISGVTSAVGALSLQALHETGTVPTIVATVKTGGQTISTSTKEPTATPAQEAAEQACLQKLFQGAIASNTTKTTTPKTTTGSTPRRGAGGFGGTGTGGATGGSSVNRSGILRFAAGLGSNSAAEKCLTPAQQAYITKVVVPEQTVRQVLNPPSTNTATTSYTVAGVDPSNPTTGLITKSQVVSGSWFGTKPANEILVNTAYASTKKLKAGDKLTLNSKTYDIVGLVSPTLTGDVSDLYFDLPTLQSMSSASGYVNEVLVAVKNSSDVDAVAAAIHKELPGAQVLTAKSLADSVSGSLANARKLANTLGSALAIVVLLAAFLIAGLLTLSSVAKRVREIGSLRAIGWTRGEIVRQIMAETVGIGIIGGIVGVGIGVLVCVVIGAIGPGLSVTSTGLAVGASSAGSIVHQSTSGTVASVVHLTAPIHPTTILLALAGAIVGGLLAGAAGGWRAARLAPATALRDLG
jgi:ABC-type antimicrobial peptide transport system permease subunit